MSHGAGSSHAKTLRHSLDKQTLAAATAAVSNSSGSGQAAALRGLVTKAGGPFAEKDLKTPGQTKAKAGSYLVSSMSTPQLNTLMAPGGVSGLHHSSSQQ